MLSVLQKFAVLALVYYVSGGHASTCKVNEFRCSNGERCIPMRWRCARASHGPARGSQCSDGSDEGDCGPCPEGQLSCDDGRCVQRDYFCDGTENCADGSDEKDCGYGHSDILLLNEGPYVYIKKRTKAGLEFTHLLPISLRMKRTGVHNGLKITGLAYDVRNQNLFISDVGEPAIIAVNTSSFDWRYLVKDRITSPMDVAFDWSSNNVYWVDSGRGTVEVVSVDSRRRTVVVGGLSNPVSIALSPKTGTMFVATTGFGKGELLQYEMKGGSSKWMISVQGSPASIALHPNKGILYWTDPREGTISYIDYHNTSIRETLREKIGGVMSVAVTEKDFYFTSGEPITSERAHRDKNPGFEKDEGWKSITFGMKPSGKWECLFMNGGCDYLCLTSAFGRSCACQSGKTLGKDGKSCKD